LFWFHSGVSPAAAKANGFNPIQDKSSGVQLRRHVMLARSPFTDDQRANNDGLTALY
jgi:hypothetical protein